ncbi:MAG: DNA polymerase III subunit alpha, partial [Desulfosudaceae bacterium]
MTTAANQFVHLHVHTCYSILDGIIRPDDLVARAVEDNMPAVAITDHGTMFGVMDFYRNAVRAGIKPIIGCECYVAPRSIADKTPQDHDGIAHLVLLAENMEGYGNLCRLATIAQQEGFYHQPRIDKDLLREHAQGLIGLSACLQGEIPRLIRQGRQDEADEAARQYCEILGGDNFFLEIQNNGLRQQVPVNQALLDMSQRLSIPLVGTNDCHYLNPEDSRVHEIALCLQSGTTIHDSDRRKTETNQLHFKSAGEMGAFLEPFPQAAANTLVIAERCQVAFDFQAVHFPVLETPPGRTMADELASKARKGLQKRWERISAQAGHAAETAYQERLDYELSVIKDHGIESWFLIMADVIAYARDNGIPIGPGRGATGGSLTCFCLGITGLDPVEHGLLFERFLHPERQSIPYSDVDTCINGREAIFKYLRDKYSRSDGEAYVGRMATLGIFKSRATIRDVGRVLGIPWREVDKIAKLIPSDARDIDAALQKEPALKKRIDSKPEFGELMEVSRKLEGLPRHVSRHAAGIVIGDKPLPCYTPLFRFNNEMITQFGAREIERLGLLRLDLLGLRHLTVMADTLGLINRQGRKVPDLDYIDTADAATGDLLSQGDTSGVFQLESVGMKEMLVKARPRSLSEVSVLIALYRPGPWDTGMVADYFERKQGLKETTYLLAELEPLLKETCGLIIYQEQIMRIAQRLAGYTPAESNDLRIAFGKKIAAKLAEHRQRFINGAVAKGMERIAAQKLFALLKHFGGYGFNKAHSMAYALIAWQMAYLKAHFPVEFMAAWLNISLGESNRIACLIDECRASNIPVLGPDINQNAKQFAVDGGQIRCGLAIVKKTDEDLAEAIISERIANGPFTSLPDFCHRLAPVHPEILQDKEIVANLIKAGGFDGTGATRAQMMAALDNILNLSAAESPAALPEADEWHSRLRLALEKTALGFYLEAAPLTLGHITSKHQTTTTLPEMYANPESGRVSVGGIWKTVSHQRKKDECAMATAELEDNNAIIKVIIPPEIYASARHMIMPELPVIVEGCYVFDEITIGPLQAERIIPLTDTTSPKLPADEQGVPLLCLACPFCGHPDLWLYMASAPPLDFTKSSDFVMACQIKCADCQAVGPMSFVDINADYTQAQTAAIDQWNQRYTIEAYTGGEIRPCPFCGHHPPEIDYLLDPDPPEAIDTGIIEKITCRQCGAACASRYACDSCLT